MSVVDIHDLGLAREAGSDVVGVGALVQRPLAAVIARARSVRRPRDLEGRRVGVTGLPSDEAVLRAVVENDGGDYEQRAARSRSASRPCPSLIAGRVDAVVVVLERGGGGAATARRAHARVPRGRLRRAALPRAGARREARDAARSAPSSWTTMLDAIAARHATRRSATATRRSTRLVDASGADEPLVRAQLGAVAPRPAPAGAPRPRGARGLGALRRALRDPARGARREPSLPAALASVA